MKGERSPWEHTETQLWPEEERQLNLHFSPFMFIHLHFVKDIAYVDIFVIIYLGVDIYSFLNLD